MSAPTCGDRNGPFRHKWFVAHGYECPYCEIERLTRTTVNQRNELARLTFDNNHNFKATAKLQIEIERLTRELDHFKNSGIIEVAVRNPNVSSYMDHWEGRATKAEAEVERLRAAISEALSAFNSIDTNSALRKKRSN